MPRLVRLTHAQYDHSVRDLLHLPDVTPAASFVLDPTFSGFDNNAAALQVGDALARDYRRAAEELAELVVSAPAALASVLGCEPAAEGCAEHFVTTFGRRAFRRPLSQEDIGRYLALFEVGRTAYGEPASFTGGVRLVLEAFLQSPHFLYRIELSQPVAAGDAIIPLSGYEVATRLAFLLWSSSPDDALLDAAGGGVLDTPEGIEEEARRMLADPRAQRTLDDFHYQWLHLSRYQDVAKSADLYPDWHDGMADATTRETLTFVRHVALELESDLETLMSAPFSFVNADLARLYGVEGDFDDIALTRVDLDPSQRAGLLTQIGFLASHAFSDISSPIHRGVFVQRQILCYNVPPPPGNADLNLPKIEGDIKTTRQQVTVHTSPDYCKQCHKVINETGFAFESYDAVGAWRTHENDVPVDTAVTVPVGLDYLDFEGSMDFVHTLATSEVVERCYLLNWYRYANARQETADDLCTIEALHEKVSATGYNIKELLVALTQTTTFRYRAVEDEEVVR